MYKIFLALLSNYFLIFGDKEPLGCINNQLSPDLESGFCRI